MSKDMKGDRVAILWAAFTRQTPISPSGGLTQAVMASERMKLWMDWINGMPCLVIEEVGTPNAGKVPWSNVSAFDVVKR